MSQIDLARLEEQLGIDASLVEVKEVEVTPRRVNQTPEGQFKVAVKELTVSFKVNPKNTYSPTETSMTVTVSGASKEQMAAVKQDLANQVIDYTIKTALQAIKTATDNKLL